MVGRGEQSGMCERVLCQVEWTICSAEGATLEGLQAAVCKVCKGLQGLQEQK